MSLKTVSCFLSSVTTLVSAEQAKPGQIQRSSVGTEEDVNLIQTKQAMGEDLDGSDEALLQLAQEQERQGMLKTESQDQDVIKEILKGFDYVKAFVKEEAAREAAKKAEEAAKAAREAAKEEAKEEAAREAAKDVDCSTHPYIRGYNPCIFYLGDDLKYKTCNCVHVLNQTVEGIPCKQPLEDSLQDMCQNNWNGYSSLSPAQKCNTAQCEQCVHSPLSVSACESCKLCCVRKDRRPAFCTTTDECANDYPCAAFYAQEAQGQDVALIKEIQKGFDDVEAVFKEEAAREAAKKV